MEPTHIEVRGACEHNLRNVDLRVPRDALVVFTGVSGSGKSSLAFDTIFKEGQRRFMESLSAYARQFLGQMERPKVEAVEGISPTLSIDQKTVNRNPRSTVGTVTEIYDHLRLLMARLGTPRCPECGTEVSRLTVDHVVDQVLGKGVTEPILVLGPVVRDRKGEYRKELEQLARDGWVRARIDGTVRRLDEEITLARYEKHTIEVVVDRLAATQANRGRLAEALETGLRLGEGTATVLIKEGDGVLGESELVFSTERACPNHPDISIPELEPRLFSFNAPQGACPGCQGLGLVEQFEVALLVELDRPAIDAFQAFNEEGRLAFSHFDRDALAGVVKALKGPAKVKVRDWPDDARHKLLFGDETLEVETVTERPNGQIDRRKAPWRGLVGIAERVWRFTSHPGLARFRTQSPCTECGGLRLNPIARAVRFRDRGVVELSGMSVRAAHAFFSSLKLTKKEKETGELLVQEIRDRLTFLHDVGLDYLTLDRRASTLSGGEAQRIRLAAQVGSALQGVTYVLDEPSIGLHPRDNQKLLATLRALRDRGNTVIVVEHDVETIEAADYVVDVGPGAGRQGGIVTAHGPLAKFRRSSCLTARHLRGDEVIPVPDVRRKGSGKALVVRGARANNLRNVDVRFPLGTLTVVTGVSGSGKSSLVFQVLEEAVTAALEKRPHVVPCDGVDGVAHVGKLIRISQTPIGRTPRSNPATYTGAFDHIRDLFAKTPEARARGYKKGRFSFNVAGGRCEVCQGAGVQTIEMQFLPTVEVVCDGCAGRRFDLETLEVTYKGRNIHDVLAMTVAEAFEVFQAVPALARILGTLVAVGLDYLPLGQPSTTVSGGEAQRIKLASELQRPSSNRHRSGSTLYLLDEPTTGLHFADVRRLIAALEKLVDAGHTVVVVEHHLDLVKRADHVVDLGPEGGDGGGLIIGEGTPEHVATLDTPTGRALAVELGGRLLAAESAPGTATTGRSRRKRPERAIVVEGARKHNLQRVDIAVPHNKTTVITGVSGSGKTSLAFDTVFSEGQRQYVESLSTYARRFLGRMERAPVDHVEGLAPAIAIDQRNASHNPRSTVATVTEIHDVLRILYARIGVPHCPDCDRVVLAHAPSGAARYLADQATGAGWLTAPLRPADHPEVRRKALLKDGWVRLWAGQEVELADPAAAGHLAAGCELVIDRLDPRKTLPARLSEAVAQAYTIGAGRALFRPRKGAVVVVTARAECPDHGAVLPEALTPRHFSFNSRLGACPRCDGLGVARQIDPARLFPEPSAGLWDAMDPRIRSVMTRSARTRSLVDALLAHLGLTHDTPIAKWAPAHRELLLEGTTETFGVTWSQEWGQTRRVVEEERAWPGLLNILDGWNSRLDWLTVEAACPACRGARLRRELRAVRIHGDGIHAFAGLCVSDALARVDAWTFTGPDAEIAERPLLELRRRLGFLVQVGLGYLELDRAAITLSGGESQRIRLASQLGGGLTGVVYVLDEPTIGLHPRDTGRLLDTLDGLRDAGNTVLLVEHDPETILRADHVIDLGPGAGIEGGHVLASGTPKALMADPRSVTGRWLAGVDTFPPRERVREPRSWITLTGATGNNLKGDEARFPTGVWLAVTGVSGSGKSTLVMDTLAPALQKGLGAEAAPAAHAGLTLGEAIDRVVVVDQSPIGRTPRSTPATYSDILGPLRSLFAETPGAQARGWGPGRFSFNTPGGGRCTSCEGRGAVLVEMHFLPDVWITCDSCGGRRYDRETLEVRWRGHSIADVLAMPIRDAHELFANHRSVAKKLGALVDVGLGYVTLGQPGTTLSGGEAQRVKLASELVSRRGHCVYVLDEPTTGLHLSDVARLVAVLHKLVDQGHTVITIEHHLDVLRQADWLIDLGPEGGAGGGRILATGTPGRLARADTPTGAALRAR